MTKPKVTASAAGKLMLSVGYAVVHGYPTVVTAVDQRLNVTVEKNGDDALLVNAPDLGLRSYTKTIGELGTRDLPKAVRFIEMLYKRFLEKWPQNEGIIVTTNSDFSASYGFGSSSAVSVAFAKALTTLYGIDLSNEELFDLCYRAVLDVQGVGSGYDLAAAIWGGTLRYVKPAKEVKKININNLQLVICYSGQKADTPTLIRMVDSFYEREPKKVEVIFEKIAKIADDLAVSLHNNDWKKTGELFNESQQAARDLGVSTTRLEELILTAQKAGALGVTSSGAAGGDCILALVDDNSRQKVIRELKTIGGEIIEVGLDSQGVRVEQQL